MGITKLLNGRHHPHIYNFRLAVARIFCTVRCSAYYTLKCHYFRTLFSLATATFANQYSFAILLWTSGTTRHRFVGRSGKSSIISKIGLVASRVVGGRTGRAKP
jgi:hypothetical protein